MGREARAGDVETIRTKVGTVAAEAVSALRLDVDELRRTHKAFAYELETFRREVAIAKAAPAELRRDVLTFRGDLTMKAEQIEALGLRLDNVGVMINLHQDQLNALERLRRDVTRGDFDKRILSIECFLSFRSFGERVRWLFTGYVRRVDKDG